LIERYFPKAGAVCDIGGGPGRYAIELRKRRYDVTLFDLSEKLLRRAEQAFVAAGTSGIRVVHGDARSVGLRIVSYAGVESFLSGMGPLLEPLSRCESGVYDNLVEVAAETAELPRFRDATDHLHFVVER
jgi:SAM-dependent methyltransferase